MISIQDWIKDNSDEVRAALIAIERRRHTLDTSDLHAARAAMRLLVGIAANKSANPRVEEPAQAGE